MKKIDEVKTKLESLKPELRERFQVETIGVFGSFVRGEQTSKSDIDILVEFTSPILLIFLTSLHLRNFSANNLELK